MPLSGNIGVSTPNGLSLYSGLSGYSGVAGFPAPAQYYNFLSGSIPASLTFSRASNAAYYNSAGILTTATTNAPRFDYNPATLARNGLLIEQASTNIILFSQAFTNVSWVQGNISITDNAVVSPDGTTDASMLNVVSLSTPSLYQNFSCSPSTVYTLSFWASDPNGVDPQYAIYDQTNSVFLVASTAYTTTANWVRYSFTFTTGATTAIARVYPVRGAANLGIMYIYGAQVEALGFSTSYMPTTTVAVTRAQDFLNATSIPWFNQLQGTMAVEFLYNKPNTSAFNSFLASFNDTSLNNRVETFIINANDTTAYRYEAAGVQQSPANSINTISLTAPNKVGLSYSSGIVLTSLNAVTGGTSTPAGTLVGVSQLNLGNQTGNSPLNGWLRTFQYWNYAQNQSQINGSTGAL